MRVLPEEKPSLDTALATTPWEVPQLGKCVYGLYARIFRRSPSVYSVGDVQMELNVSESPMMIRRRFGRFEPEVDEFISKHLDTGTYLDIGANKGYHALQAATSNPSATVVAFEPDPSNIEAVRRNVRLNDCDVGVEPIALGEKSGTAQFSSGEAISGAGRLDTEGDITVQIDSLDSWLKADDTPAPESVDVCKIDVEGAEEAVLRGMSSLLEFPHEFSVIVELHPGEVDIASVINYLDKFPVELELAEPNYLCIFSRSGGA